MVGDRATPLRRQHFSARGEMVQRDQKWTGAPLEMIY
jgi:hypothetical protein